MGKIIEDETLEALKVPSISTGVGIVAGMIFGGPIGIAVGLGTLYALAVAGGQGITEQKDAAQEWLDNTPDRPRGIKIRPDCSCEECEEKRKLKDKEKYAGIECES